MLLGEHKLTLVKWGQVVPWAKDAKSALINARAEGIANKPMFRRAFRSQRCLIPTSGFYEWQAPADGSKRKTPNLFTITDRDRGTDDDLFAFAGLWETWKDRTSGQKLRSCAIITTTPNALVAPIHDRMPVILRRADEAEWLDPALHDVGRLGAMLLPYPAEAMHATPADAHALRA